MPRRYGKSGEERFNILKGDEAMAVDMFLKITDVKG